MKSNEYVGITGPVNAIETNNICKQFSDANYNMHSKHIPMLGFLVSYKTLNEIPTENRRYPKFEAIPELLELTNNKVLTMIHYNSKEMNTLSDQVAKIFENIYENNLCKALQLNIVWPDIKQVEQIMKKHPDMKIVFQASHKAMEGLTPKEIASRVKEYNEFISYVLIDPSGGRGMSFDVNSSVKIYSELKNKCPDLTIGFAGGFTGDNVGSRVEEIIEKTGDTNFCIDAEGGLRDKITPAYGDDLMNFEKVKAYLQAASSVLY